MPRKPPNPFDIMFERIMDEVIVPALDEKIRPVIDQMFQQMPPPPPNGRHKARKRMRVDPRPTSPPYWEWPPASWGAAPPRFPSPSAPSHYDTLQVSKNADVEVIRAAYLQLCKRNHPDHNPGDKRCEERMKLITAAYEILSDPHKRAAYDRTI